MKELQLWQGVMVEINIRRMQTWYQVYEGWEKIAADTLSRWTNNGNQETTHEKTYTTETMSELYDIKELPDGTFTLSFNLIDRYQREDPFLTEKNAQNLQRVLFSEAGII